MSECAGWSPAEARDMIAVPRADDDKYSRGVLGVMTGSEEYPGAAVLGVDAALRTGVGMVRYLGPKRATDLVLARRPEVVTVPGRVQAWLLGSGMTDGAIQGADRQRVMEAAAAGLPLVVDAGALDLAADLAAARAQVVVTPHAGELARMLDTSRQWVSDNPGSAAWTAAEQLGVTVLLKGNRTHIAGIGGLRLTVQSPTAWLATAGTGDALGGILGALVATNAAALLGQDDVMARLAATACVIHGLAADRAGGHGPFTVLDLTAAIGPVIAGLLSSPGTAS